MPQEPFKVKISQPAPTDAEFPPDKGVEGPPLASDEEVSARMSPGAFYTCPIDGYTMYVPYGCTWWRCGYGHTYWI